MPRGSLATRLIAAQLLAVLIALAAIGFAAWSVARRALEDELGRRLASVAGAAGSGLPLDLLLTLQPGDEQTRTFRRTFEQLRRVVAESQLRRLALFRPDGRVICDTAGVPIGALLPDLARDELELGHLWRGESTASQLLFRDAAGQSYKSGYAPLRLSGQVVAGAVAEGNGAFFSVLGQLEGRLLAVGLLGALLTFFVSLLLARSISAPIRRLVGAARRIEGGDLATPIALSPRGAGGDEIDFLGGTLEEMRLALSDRDRQLQLMLSGIAHEVRNPLGGIELFAGLLGESLPREGEAADQLRRIQRELGHLKRVVEEFLDFARKPRVVREPIAAQALAEELVALGEPEATPKGLCWELRTSDPRPFHADPGLLRRALLNLVRNAIQASPVGGPLRIEFSRSPRGFCWTVEDGGPGVPAERREEIFTPFFTTRQQGTGLGLALVRRIAEAHGGRVEVQASSLGGARFDLELPDQGEDGGAEGLETSPMGTPGNHSPQPGG